MGWTFSRRLALPVELGALVASAFLGVGCQTGPFLQTEQHETRAGEEEQIGSACLSVEKGGGLGGGRAPGVPGAAGEGGDDGDYSFSYDGTGGGVRFRVLDGGGKSLADKSYDSAFIDSGRKDEVTIELGGRAARFVAWGVPHCGQP
jgi:hypothetical protein